MSLESYNISYIVDTNGDTVFPVTHSNALVGPLSKRLYNISDRYNNNWDNVTENGYYKDVATGSIVSSDGYDFYDFYYDTTIGVVNSYEPYSIYYNENPMLLTMANIEADHQYYEDMGMPEPTEAITEIASNISNYLPTNNYTEDNNVAKMTINGIHIMSSTYTKGAPSSPSTSDINSMLPLEKSSYDIQKVNNVNHTIIVVNDIYVELTSYDMVTRPTLPTITITYPVYEFSKVSTPTGFMYIFVYEDSGTEYHLKFIDPVVEYDSSSIYNRPPSSDNYYGESCFIRVINSGNSIIQQTDYPSTNHNSPIIINESRIAYNYYRTGNRVTDSLGNNGVIWDNWSRVTSPGSLALYTTTLEILHTDWEYNNPYYEYNTNIGNDISNSIIVIQPINSSANDYYSSGVRATIVSESQGIIKFIAVVEPENDMSIIVTIFGSDTAYNDADISEY